MVAAFGYSASSETPSEVPRTPDGNAVLENELKGDLTSETLRFSERPLQGW